MAKDDVVIQIGGETSKYERSMRNVQLTTQKTTQLIHNYWIAAAASFYTVAKAWDTLQTAAKAEQEAKAFANLAATYGKSANEIVSALKRASNETLDTATIINKAGTAMMMGLDPTTIVKLMEIARATARQTGQSVADAFSDISLGVARQSKMILDNLGIVVNVEKANADYAASLKKTSAQLTDAEKKQAFLNATMEAGDELMSRINVSNTSAAESIQQFEAAMADLKTQLAMYLLPTLSSIVSATADAIQGFRIFFRIGEEESLSKDLIKVNDELDKIDKKLVHLKGARDGTIIDTFNYDDRETQRKIDKLEAEKTKKLAEMNEIQRKIRDLNKPVTFSGATPAGAFGGAAGEMQTIAPKTAATKTAASDAAERAQKEEEEYLADSIEAVQKSVQEKNEIRQQAIEEEEAYESQYLNDSIAQVEAAVSAKEDLRKNLMYQNQKYALSELQYEKWMLNQEVAAMRKTAGEDMALQDQITEYHRSKMAEIATDVSDQSSDMKTAISGWASSFSGDLADAVLGADLNFKNIAKSFARMLLQMYIQKRIIEPLLSSWGGGSSMGGGYGGGSPWAIIAQIAVAVGSAYIAKKQIEDQQKDLEANAKGNIYGGSGLHAYRNKIVNRPTLFPFENGIGVMGEAGYEGILPLTRTRSGDLGVKAEGGGTMVEQNFYITGNQVWDQRSMEQLMTNISATVAAKVAPNAVAKDYGRDGVTRSVFRHGV